VPAQHVPAVVLKCPQVIGWSVGQAHAPVVQVALAGHRFPHVPQLPVSEARFTHAPALVPTTGHTSGALLGQRHALVAQDAPAAQVVVHVPQCALSVASETQVPGEEPHTSGRLLGHLQLPATHTSFVSGQA